MVPQSGLLVRKSFVQEQAIVKIDFAIHFFTKLLLMTEKQ